MVPQLMNHQSVTRAVFLVVCFSSAPGFNGLGWMLRVSMAAAVLIWRMVCEG